MNTVGSTLETRMPGVKSHFQQLGQVNLSEPQFAYLYPRNNSMDVLSIVVRAQNMAQKIICISITTIILISSTITTTTITTIITTITTIITTTTITTTIITTITLTIPSGSQFRSL